MCENKKVVIKWTGTEPLHRLKAISQARKTFLNAATLRSWQT